MADPRYLVIEVTLFESCGPFGTVGEPTMFCRYSAAHLPGTHLDDGKVNVVVRDDTTQSWREYVRKTTFDDARGVIAQLKALGIPGRTPKAEGVVDTSDGWTTLSFRVKAEKDAMAFDIGMQSSGFDGADAEQLRVLFRDLFALAGFEAYCPVVYGPCRTMRCT
jgi:hypothetical protein